MIHIIWDMIQCIWDVTQCMRDVTRVEMSGQHGWQYDI